METEQRSVRNLARGGRVFVDERLLSRPNALPINPLENFGFDSPNTVATGKRESIIKLDDIRPKAIEAKDIPI